MPLGSVRRCHHGRRHRLYRSRYSARRNGRHNFSFGEEL